MKSRSAKYRCANSLRPLPGIKILVNRKDNAVHIAITPGKTGAGAAREFLYRVLNAYEPHFSVFIKGVPYCFLPDAYDHIVHTPGGKSGLRLPICGRCRLKPVCPGLEPGSWFCARPGQLAPVLAIPNEIVLEVNRRCNLACAVCSSRSLDAELSLAAIRRHLARARALGIKNIRFTGGEPFLHPRILPALAAAKKLGFYVLVNTNATLLDRGLIKKAAPFIDNVLVSMQGCDAAGETAATGRNGLFAKKTENIRLLKSCGIPVLRLGTVISDALLENPGKYLRLARSFKADVWELYRPMSAAGSDGPPAINPRSLRRLADKFEPLMRQKPRVVFANPVPFCLFKKKQAPLFLGATFDDGHSRLVVDPRGFYKPSYYIQKNVGAAPLRAWNSAFLKKIAGLEYLRGKCRRCVFRLRCFGGSRFMAKAARGDHFKNDPWLPAGRR
ncbi:MAG: hypothetical protein A2234_03200 [Elusimicrobia bacterium RIFOXYA2_FULL_58_8]|nr:MAG: hypothetical protein A2285_02555 [Elusimicrobia bacterium RIFOXYA12_FULL_57_11]OGS17258.1 MAG: hypothetical protein A2234_03200 [Elusimicrobia bacterium RIFOXYA2_FULL_58_8]